MRNYFIDGGSADIEYLESLIDTAQKLGIDFEDIKEHINEFVEELSSKPSDVNTWIYCVHYMIFYKVIDEANSITNDFPYTIESIIRGILDGMSDDFSPYINYLDSSFGNLLDDVNLDQSLEDVAEDLVNEIIYEEIDEIVIEVLNYISAYVIDIDFDDVKHIVHSRWQSVDTLFHDIFRFILDKILEYYKDEPDYDALVDFCKDDSIDTSYLEVQFINPYIAFTMYNFTDKQEFLDSYLKQLREDMNETIR